MQTISDRKAFPAGSNRIVKIKRQRFFWPLLLAIFFLSAGSSYGQNISRMNSGVNTQTVSPYTVVCSDALKLVILNSASAFAVNLPSAATCGTGYVFQLKNLGAGLVTITPLFGNIDGSSSITLVTGSGVDIYNDGTNYFTQSGKGSFTNPMSILGDLITENSTPAAARLPGPTGPNGVPQVLTNTPSGGLSGANLWGPPGLAERDVTGTTATDTIASTDCNPKAVFYQGSVAVAVTLPTATTLAVPNCVFSLTNITTGSSTAVTVTPTTWTVTPGGSSLVIAQGQSCRFSVDNAVATQWDAVCHDLQLTAGSNITITRGQYGPTIAASGGGAFPITVSGTVTSGGIPYFNSTTQESSSALLTLNVLVKGGGAGGAPANSSITDNGTTVTTTDTGGYVAPVFTANGTTAGYFQCVQGSANGHATVNTITEECPAAVTAYELIRAGTAATGIPLRTNSANVVTESILTSTVAGDVLVGSGTTWTILGGNASGTKCLTETSAGSASWGTCGGGTTTYPVTVAGTVNSGGIPYFNSTTQESSSALLTANALVVGGGAGAAPATGNADFTYVTHTLTAAAAGLVDFSAQSGANSFKVPVGAGLTSGANGVITYDTTAGATHVRSNAADSLAAAEAAAIVINTVPKATNSTNSLITASSMIDNGTSVTSTDTGGFIAPVFTANGSTAGFIDYPQGSTSAAVAPCNTATSICEQAPTAV